MESKFYDGTKLLSMKDINGETPEIFMCTSNRSAGKTTYFGRYVVNRFLKYGEKFMLLYRYNYELDDISDKFFKDLKYLFFKYNDMNSRRMASGIFQELYLDSKPCGYAVSMNSADQLKRYSHLFSDTQRILFDEFQSETNHYCPNEINKFISIHTSVARGAGKQVRYVPVIMLSNTVSLLNPYYTAMNISGRLRTDTKFLRGDGFVLEQGFVESASKAQKDSLFNRAFAENEYISYSAENVYLNDNYSFIEKPKGKSKYIATLKYMGRNYAVREFKDLGIIYCDTRYDEDFKYAIAVTTDDHNINYIMLRSNDMFICKLRYFFERGVFRFQNLECKQAILAALTY